MASCPKCDNQSFSLSEIAPTGSQYKINLVVCSNCDIVVGALEKEAVGVLVYHLAKAVDRIATKIGIDSGLPPSMRSRR